MTRIKIFSNIITLGLVARSLQLSRDDISAKVSLNPANRN